MIEDDSTPVIVKYPDAPAMHDEHPVTRLLDRVRTSKNLNRAYLRALQPYTVSLLAHEFKKAQQQGLVLEVIPGVWEWLGAYDSGQDGKHGQGILIDSALSAESNIW